VQQAQQAQPSKHDFQLAVSRRMLSFALDKAQEQGLDPMEMSLLERRAEEVQKVLDAGRLAAARVTGSVATLAVRIGGSGPGKFEVPIYSTVAEVKRMCARNGCSPPGLPPSRMQLRAAAGGELMVDGSLLAAYPTLLQAHPGACLVDLTVLDEEALADAAAVAAAEATSATYHQAAVMAEQEQAEEYYKAMVAHQMLQQQVTADERRLATARAQFYAVTLAVRMDGAAEPGQQKAALYSTSLTVPLHSTVAELKRRISANATGMAEGAPAGRMRLLSEAGELMADGTLLSAYGVRDGYAVRYTITDRDEPSDAAAVAAAEAAAEALRRTVQMEYDAQGGYTCFRNMYGRLRFPGDRAPGSTRAPISLRDIQQTGAVYEMDPSGRAMCRFCYGNLTQDTMRVRAATGRHWASNADYYHPRCWDEYVRREGWSNSQADSVSQADNDNEASTDSESDGNDSDA
jgi:hypothetical protein